MTRDVLLLRETARSVMGPENHADDRLEGRPLKVEQVLAWKAIRYDPRSRGTMRPVNNSVM